MRNAVGIKFRPGTNDLWMSVNERDALGDGLVPDYISRVQPGGFYGWPWFYLGNHQDPRHKGKHPELADKVLVPDVLVQSHSATLNLCFYDGQQFPAEYKGDIFAAFHGSWNKKRAHRLQDRPRAASTNRPAKRAAITRISSPVSSRRKETSGAGRSASPSRKTAACSSAKTATIPSGG